MVPISSKPVNGLQKYFWRVIAESAQINHSPCSNCLHYRSTSTMTQGAKELSHYYTIIHDLIVNCKNEVVCTKGKSFILPAANIILSTLFKDKATQKIDEIPLSSSTVKRRIYNLLHFWKCGNIFFSQTKGSYSLHLDKSSGIADNIYVSIKAFLKWQLSCHGLYKNILV